MGGFLQSRHIESPFEFSYRDFIYDLQMNYRYLSITYIYILAIYIYIYIYCQNTYIYI